MELQLNESIVRHLAVSRMGRYSPSVLISGKEMFIALRAYLDCSGKPESRFVSLAAFGAPDDVWNRFESGWKDILDTADPCPVPYMHMVEAIGMRHESPFAKNKGWTYEKIWTLIWRLVMHMGSFNQHELLTFNCVVDMEAHRRLTAEGLLLPSAIELCNHYCCKVIIGTTVASLLQANLTDSEDIDIKNDDLINFVFDRSEPFLEPFRAERNREVNVARQHKRFSPWLMVDGITDGVMERTPGIQAADVLAWSLNRENTLPSNPMGTGVAGVFRNVVAGSSILWDEERFRKTCGAKR